MDRREVQPRVSNGRTDDARSGQIKADIDNTRDRIDQTLDALGNKLRPKNLIEEAFEYFSGGEATGGQQVRSTAQKLGVTLWHQVQEHPMPSLLIGAGVAWLFSEQRRSRAYYGPQPASISSHSGGVGESISGAAHSLGARVSEVTHSGKEGLQGMAHSGKESLEGLAHSGKEKMGEMVGGMEEKARELRDMGAEQVGMIKEKASRLGAQTREQASAALRSSEARFSQTLEEYPLAMGVGFLALGVLAGLALPHTRIEDDALGTRSDQLKDQVKSKTQDIVGTAEKVAMAAGSAAFEEAEKQGLTLENLGNKVSHVATEAAHVVSQKAKEEGLGQEDLTQQVKSVAQEAKRAAKDEMRKGKSI
jgi:hypothetical protein